MTTHSHPDAELLRINLTSLRTDTQARSLDHKTMGVKAYLYWKSCYLVSRPPPWVTHFVENQWKSMWTTPQVVHQFEKLNCWESPHHQQGRMGITVLHNQPNLWIWELAVANNGCFIMSILTSQRKEFLLFKISLLHYIIVQTYSRFFFFLIFRTLSFNWYGALFDVKLNVFQFN